MDATPTDKGRFFDEARDRLGADDEAEKLTALLTEMRPIANAIDALPVTSLEGLRAKAMVAFWNVLPCSATDSEYFFQDEVAFQRLFVAVAQFCGLAGSVAATGYTMPEWPIIEEEAEA
ncbi:hypothetical protein [Bradyrhizobium sp. BR 1433]|uniref:hypothetical protein n=1 Tax=Bradyrhizobium sp. BR 1433 TaxID=3447967 RepID=UPI003EE61D01